MTASLALSLLHLYNPFTAVNQFHTATLTAYYCDPRFELDCLESLFKQINGDDSNSSLAAPHTLL